MAQYEKIYGDFNILDRYKDMVIVLEDKLKKTKEENALLKDKLDADKTQQRINEAINILNSSIKHYKDYKKNDAVVRAIEILKGVVL